MSSKVDVDRINALLEGQAVECSFFTVSGEVLPILPMKVSETDEGEAVYQTGNVEYLGDGMFQVTGHLNTRNSNPQTWIAHYFSLGGLKLLGSSANVVEFHKDVKAEIKNGQESDDDDEESTTTGKPKAPKAKMPKAKKPTPKAKAPSNEEIVARRREIMAEFPYELDPTDWANTWRPLSREVDIMTDDIETTVDAILAYYGWERPE